MLIFDKIYNKLIFEQFYNLPEDKQSQIIRILSNEKIFIHYLNIENNEPEISNKILQIFQNEDKVEAIKNLLSWKRITLKNNVYILLGIANEKENPDYSLNIQFERYNLKSGNIENQLIQIYGRIKAIYYSMLRQHKSLQFIYNTLCKDQTTMYL